MRTSRKCLFWVLLLVMLCIVSYGGCGGGSSSGGGGTDSGNGGQDPSGGTTTYSFSVLEGRWTASNGTGTGSNSGGAFTLELQDGSYTEFSNIQAIDDKTMTVHLKMLMLWKALRNGVQINEGDEGEEEEDTARFTRVNGNIWRWTFDEDRDGTHTFDITITSPTTASVQEEFGFTDDDSPTVYPCKISYTLKK